MSQIALSEVKIVTMVGSRKVEPHQRDVMLELGKGFCEQGCEYRSGLAGGNDLASYIGYKHGENYDPALVSNYVVKHRFFHDEYAKGTTKALSDFTPKLIETARKLAEEARGSWHGLDDWGIDLHTRNAFQVLGDDLESPSDLIVLGSEPIGKSEDYSKVKGGTNTAFRIAKKFNIPHLNVFTKEDYAIAKRDSFRQPLEPMIDDYERIMDKYYRR